MRFVCSALQVIHPWTLLPKKEDTRSLKSTRGSNHGNQHRPVFSSTDTCSISSAWSPVHMWRPHAVWILGAAHPVLQWRTLVWTSPERDGSHTKLIIELHRHNILLYNQFFLQFSSCSSVEHCHVKIWDRIQWKWLLSVNMSTAKSFPSTFPVNIWSATN